MSGDTVAAMLPNIPAMNEAHFAVPMTGAVLSRTSCTAPRAAAPNSEFHGPRGPNRLTGCPDRAARLRNIRCVTKIISHTKIPPKNAEPSMYTYAVPL